MTKFKEIFKRLRAERKIGQKDLAEKLGVSKGVISFWETGRNEPTAIMLIKISRFFNVSVDYLLGLEDDLGNKIR